LLRPFHFLLFPRHFTVHSKPKNKNFTFFKAKDLRALTSLQQKHKALEDEMMRRHARFQNGPLAAAEELIAGRHPEAGQLRERVSALQSKWAALQAELEKNRLKENQPSGFFLFLLVFFWVFWVFFVYLPRRESF